MSEHKSDIEYSGTTTENTKNTQKDHISMTQPQPNKSSLFSSFQLSISSDFPDLDDPSIREKFSQNQAARLYSLSQNVNQEGIPSRFRGVTTRKSHGIHERILNATGMGITKESAGGITRKRSQECYKEEGDTKSKTKEKRRFTAHERFLLIMSDILACLINSISSSKRSRFLQE